MKAFVGTSGWSYAWNKGRSLQWYIDNTSFNAVELNASFYRFPFPAYVNSWAKKGDRIRFAVKVNRFITHIHRLNDTAKAQWEKFRLLFKPLDKKIDFYLFQFPPNFKTNKEKILLEFIEYTGLNARFAAEFRNNEWFSKQEIRKIEKSGATFVSVSAPGLPSSIIKTSEFVYLRMHGMVDWYAYKYDYEELKGFAEQIESVSPEKAYVFFNNDHDMLENGKIMVNLLKSYIKY